ncbi:MAG: hypothetical protein AB1486_22135 [Planctomycetota bacterium]
MRRWILIEASTESESVARHLERLGDEVIVADLSLAATYGTRSRRVKTDRRDAREVAEALRLGTCRPVHRGSGEQRWMTEIAPEEGLPTARWSTRRRLAFKVDRVAGDGTATIRCAIMSLKLDNPGALQGYESYDSDAKDSQINSVVWPVAVLVGRSVTFESDTKG